MTLALFPGLPKPHCISLTTFCYADWESLKAHQNLMAKPEYGPVLAKINEWADGVSFFHAALTPHPPTATFTAPATEVAKLPAKPESTKDDWLLGYHKFEKGLKNAPGYIAHASGWQIEDDRCFVLAIGWEAVEAHRDWAKSEAGSAAIKSLMERTDQEKSEMWHLCDVGAVIVN